jgi:hypothetical protein
MTAAQSGRTCSHRCKQCSGARRAEYVRLVRTMEDVDRELATLRLERDHLREQVAARPSERAIYASRYATTRPEQESAHASRARR